MLPEYIGMGLGKQLLAESIRAFVKEEKEIIVKADSNAEPFYRSQGFVTFDQVESFPKGRYLPVMRRGNLNIN
jgi:predicted GNAT family N-acyltransferase